MLTGFHIAIVGAGPTGMSAAYDLARYGYQVTLIDTLPLVGGMLAAGVPRDIVSRRVLNNDARLLMKRGVDIRLNTHIGRHLSLNALAEQTDGVLLAIGSQQEMHLDLPGEHNLTGVIPALTFLKQQNLARRNIPLKGDVVVIGNDRTAVYTARTALRAGARSVHLIAASSSLSIPISPGLLHVAHHEGVQFHPFLSPLALVGRADASVYALRCQLMRINGPESNGSCSLQNIPGTRFLLPADHIIIAAGERPGNRCILPGSDPHLEKMQRHRYQTNMPGLFVAGGLFYGPGNVEMAITEGQHVAQTIHATLQQVPEDAIDRLPDEPLHIALLHLEPKLFETEKHI